MVTTVPDEWSFGSWVLWDCAAAASTKKLDVDSVSWLTLFMCCLFRICSLLAACSMPSHHFFVSLYTGSKQRKWKDLRCQLHQP